VERITREDLKRRLDSHELTALIDVRAPEAWSASEVQLPEAIRVAPNELDRHLDEIPRDQLVVTYGSDPDDHTSVAAAQALLDAGWSDVRPLAGGFDTWKKAGYPLQAKISEMPSRLEQIEHRARDLREKLESAEGEETEER
jgi:rhodanese-related sulfurtransferase